MSQPNNQWYQANAPQPAIANALQQNPAPNNPWIYQQNSAPNNPWYPKSNSTWYPTRVLRILLIIFSIIVLIAVPLLGYFIGNLIGMHMAVSDIQQGYAYGGLLATVYNATHNQVYNQESQVSISLGIAEGQTDLNSLSLFGIGGGILADFAIAFLIVKEYERLK